MTKHTNFRFFHNRYSYHYHNLYCKFLLLKVFFLEFNDQILKRSQCTTYPSLCEEIIKLLCSQITTKHNIIIYHLFCKIGICKSQFCNILKLRFRIGGGGENLDSLHKDFFIIIIMQKFHKKSYFQG